MSKKLYLQLYLTEIVHLSSKMLFIYINVFQSFYGTPLSFSYFLLQGKVPSFARVGKSLGLITSRCSGKEPALLPELTAGLMNLALLIRPIKYLPA